MTYGELEERSSEVAAGLIQRGIEKGAVVAVCMERSIEFVCTVLGIMKSGAVYLPIDPKLPKERIRYLLEDAEAHLLVVSSAIAQLNVPCPMAPYDQLRIPYSTTALPVVREEDICYVIYTSGSSGKPKGVRVSHRALHNLIRWFVDDFQIDHRTVSGQFAGLSFDASVWELWAYLYAGGQLFLFPDTSFMGPRDIRSTAMSHRLNTLFVPTAIAEHLVGLDWPDDIPLRLLLTGGDRLKKAPPKGLPFDLINCYGPTENTVITSCGPVTYGTTEAPNIGRPIFNTAVLIVDRFDNILPCGIPGEMLICGQNLSEGYLNRPELNREKFVQTQYPNGRAYRSGDKVVLDSKGLIHFIGRVDNQVQLRGYRIELGEIENTLMDHPAILQAVVSFHKAEATRNEELIAHVYAKDSQQLDVQSLRLFLGKHLPSYMIPKKIHLEDRPLALTVNGKIDANKLLPGSKLPAEIAEENTESQRTEAFLIELWQELLQVPNVKVDDNFFSLGGHSLIAIELIERVNKKWSSDLSISTLVKNNTIELLAASLQQEETTERPSVILPLKTTTDANKEKLLLFAPIGGNVLCYTHLAQSLKVDVFGIQSPFLIDDTATFENFDALIDYYSAEIEQFNFSGSLHIGGFCAGGILALEVYRKLKAKGVPVGALALIDTAAPPPHGMSEALICTQVSREEWLDSFYKDLSVQSGEDIQDIIPILRTLSATEQLAYVRNQAIQEGYLSKETSLPQIEKLFEAYYKNAVAITQYTPSPLDESILLFKAAQIPNNLIEVPEFRQQDLGWSQYIEKEIETIIVPGNHNNMLQSKHAATLAEKLNFKLQNIEICTFEP